MAVLDVNSLDPFGDGSLKHFYKFDGDATDSVGGVNLDMGEGTISYVEGKYGNALGVNGSSNVYSNSMAMQLFKDKTPTTLSLWYKDSGDTTNKNHYILSKRHNASGSGTQIAIMYDVKTKKILVNYYTTTWIDLGFTTVFDLTSKFNLITLSMGSNGVVHLYINGILKESKGAPWSDISSDYDTYLAVGKVISDTNAAYYPRGAIDHLQIFDRALTQEEVTALYGGEIPQIIPSTQPLSPENQKSLFKEFYKANKRLLALAFPNLTVDIPALVAVEVEKYLKSKVILDESFDDNSRGWALQGNPVAGISGGSLHMESGDSSSASAMLTLADEVPATKLKITITGSEAQNVPAQLVFTAVDNTSHGVQLNTVGNNPTVYTVDTPIAIKSIRITPHDTNGYTVYDLKIEKVS